MNFDDHITAALASINRSCGRAVTLRRGTITRVITATPAASHRELTDFQHSRIDVQDRDYIVRASDYDFGTGACEPRPGDEIHDQGRRFVIGQRGGSLPCWSWSDRGRTWLRIRGAETGAL